MTTLAVRFDEELGVAHRVGSGYLPCPQGVVVDQGGYRTVKACAMEWGHVGDCTAYTAWERRGYSTVCGLDLDALPFVLAPDGLTACPRCFAAEDAAQYVEEAMFA